MIILLQFLQRYLTISGAPSSLVLSVKKIAIIFPPTSMQTLKFFVGGDQ